MEEYFSRPMKLNVVLGKADTATPALLEYQGKQLKQQQACEAIEQDNFCACGKD